MTDIRSETGQDAANTAARIAKKRRLYRDFKISVSATAALCLAVAAVEAIYRSPHMWSSLFLCVLLSFLFITLLAASNEDESRFAANQPFDDAFIKVFKKDMSVIGFVLPALVIALLGIYYSTSAVNVAIQRSSGDGWNDGTEYTYTPIANNSAEKSKGKPVDVADPCKVFEGLCDKDATKLVSLLASGFEIKGTDLSAGLVLVQKADAIYTCRSLSPRVAGYALPPEAALGSAFCKKIREASPKDMKALPPSDYSSDYSSYPRKGTYYDDYSSFGKGQWYDGTWGK